MSGPCARAWTIFRQRVANQVDENCAKAMHTVRPDLSTLLTKRSSCAQRAGSMGQGRVHGIGVWGGAGCLSMLTKRSSCARRAGARPRSAREPAAPAGRAWRSVWRPAHWQSRRAPTGRGCPASEEALVSRVFSHGRSRAPRPGSEAVGSRPRAAQQQQQEAVPG